MANRRFLALWAPALVMGKINRPTPLEEHRLYPLPDCPKWTCPAGKRPIPQEEEKFKVWTYDQCANDLDNMEVYQHQYPGTEHQKIYTMSQLGTCCRNKFVCMNTCGSTVEECYYQFWECGERVCDETTKMFDHEDDKSCLWAAKYNDLNHLCEEEGQCDRLRDQSVCAVFHAAQRKACQCVPSEQLEARTMARMGRFYLKHDETKVSPKGKLRDITGFKNWKGKRRDMWYGLFTKYGATAVELKPQRWVDEKKHVKVEDFDTMFQTMEAVRQMQKVKGRRHAELDEDDVEL